MNSSLLLLNDPASAASAGTMNYIFIIFAKKFDKKSGYNLDASLPY
jgi:hypothetical protein